MTTYSVGIVGCGRMGGFIDNEGNGTRRPVSFGAAFEASERTEIIACSDLRPNVMEQFGKRYGVPVDGQFADYRKLIDEARPDIVGIATQPEQRAEIIIYAAENGVRAIYAEKPLAASLTEADNCVNAVEHNGLVFIMGTGRRWDPAFAAMEKVIDSGELGPLQSTIMAYGAGSGLFDHGCHVLDLTLLLNGDAQAAWVQATVTDGDDIFNGNTMVKDPTGHGTIQFKSGVTSHIVLNYLHDHQAVCEGGSIGIFNSRTEHRMIRMERQGERNRRVLVPAEFPAFEPASPTLNIVNDLVQALDTGGPTRGDMRAARAGMELTFAFLESHLRGGARVMLPIEDRGLILDRKMVGRPVKFVK